MGAGVEGAVGNRWKEELMGFCVTRGANRLFLLGLRLGDVWLDQGR